MLERSWLMFQHNEIASMTRESVLAAATEMLWRMIAAQPDGPPR